MDRCWKTLYYSDQAIKGRSICLSTPPTKLFSMHCGAVEKGGAVYRLGSILLKPRRRKGGLRALDSNERACRVATLRASNKYVLSRPWPRIAAPVSAPSHPSIVHESLLRRICQPTVFSGQEKRTGKESRVERNGGRSHNRGLAIPTVLDLASSNEREKLDDDLASRSRRRTFFWYLFASSYTRRPQSKTIVELLLEMMVDYLGTTPFDMIMHL